MELFKTGLKKQKSGVKAGSLKKAGAGDEARTRDPDLGKVVLYH